jgi:polyisoprenyl-phosphate glycosyltransferase
MNRASLLTIVLPCYNEEEVLFETSSRLKEILANLIYRNLINDRSKILFVDDGSTDKTWKIITELHQMDKIFCGLQLSRNQGHQNALLAGLMEAKEYSDCIISMDVDLQDDVSVIDQFITKFHEGSDIVYGIRESRKKDSFMKKQTALIFYKLLIQLGVNIKYNHADYRLMSQRTVEALSDFKEVNLFLRGLIPLIGFNTAEVSYDRNERFAGESKYPLKKMIVFAWQGITSFSVVPLQLVTAMGFIISFLTIIAMFYVLFSKLYGFTITGWTSILISIWFLGGIQLIAIGILGEYIGKIYKETKQRPKYIIKDKLINE